MGREIRTLPGSALCAVGCFLYAKILIDPIKSEVKLFVPRTPSNQQPSNNATAKARLATNSSGRSNESEQRPEVD